MGQGAGGLGIGVQQQIEDRRGAFGQVGQVLVPAPERLGPVAATRMAQGRSSAAWSRKLARRPSSVAPLRGGPNASDSDAVARPVSVGSAASGITPEPTVTWSAPSQTAERIAATSSASPGSSALPKRAACGGGREEGAGSISRTSRRPAASRCSTAPVSKVKVSLRRITVVSIHSTIRAGASAGLPSTCGLPGPETGQGGVPQDGRDLARLACRHPSCSGHPSWRGPRPAPGQVPRRGPRQRTAPRSPRRERG